MDKLNDEDDTGDIGAKGKKAHIKEKRALLDRIESLRRARGYSKSRLAQIMGINRQVINNWYALRTWPNPVHMPLLASALGTSISYLYGDTPDSAPAPQWKPGGTDQALYRSVRMAREHIVAALSALDTQMDREEMISTFSHDAYGTPPANVTPLRRAAREAQPPHEDDVKAYGGKQNEGASQ